MRKLRCLVIAAVTALVLPVSATLVGCVAMPEWQDDMPTALRDSQSIGRELVVFFALPGRDASDKMQARLADKLVLRALQDGSFAAVVVDGIVRKRFYREWIGGGEGMGIAVLDGAGYCYAARPGPQDSEELAAFLNMCASSREDLARLRVANGKTGVDPLLQHELGCLYLQLGCRVRCELLLLDAARAGVADAKHRLARLYALDGNVSSARRWLKTAPQTPARAATEGYVLFKERRHKQAVSVLQAAIATNQLGRERQRALLYLGKSLHEDKQDGEAVLILEALANEGTGSTFEAAARHTLGHLYNPTGGHAH